MCACVCLLRVSMSMMYGFKYVGGLVYVMCILRMCALVRSVRV